ncbi:universal stress protein A [Tistrella bauzanensis]|uniref:Universal stress protein A n=1 Tax=Tistrella bauzanensis TaxID=657419 RepID=A0ABQ1IGK4_9PROT|nr:universal stress protein [Tistrella bauzanensis]GGB37451.1 universal stress protein A [Tistrella bauzanensis]
MSYKSLLVHVDDRPSTEARLDVARILKERFGAHLTAVYMSVDIVMPGYMMEHVPSSVLESAAAERKRQSKARLAEIETMLKRRHLTVEMRSESVIATDYIDRVALHARYADLTILGQPEPGTDDAGDLLIEETMFGAGRPVLVVPYIGLPKERTVGEHILAAYDGGREATRALVDALPMLKTAKTVQLLVINPKPGRHGEMPGSDMASYLARHGVKVEVVVEKLSTSDVGIGDAVLNRIAETGIDLLVMGAYGHSRLRELVLGGVTRHIMGHMTVPVLMSH